MENNYLTIAESEGVYYQVHGTGKAVVLIHGFGEDGNIWQYFIDTLKHDFLLIVPDLPGSGRSPVLKNRKEQTSIDDYAAIILNILKKEVINKCTVIGHSMGGYITLAIAEKHPEVLNGFGLFNSTAYADDENKKNDRLKSIEFIENNGAASFINRSIPGLFPDKFKQEHGNDIEELAASLQYFSGEALIQYQTAMINRLDRIKVLQNSGVPVLFIIGEKDPVIPLKKSLAQCYLSPVSYVYILPGMGHMGPVEQKQLCVEAILCYLNSL